MENEKQEEKKEGYYIPYILVDESIIKIISVFNYLIFISRNWF